VNFINFASIVFQLTPTFPGPLYPYPWYGSRQFAYSRTRSPYMLHLQVELPPLSVLSFLITPNITRSSEKIGTFTFDIKDTTVTNLPQRPLKDGEMAKTILLKSENVKKKLFLTFFIELIQGGRVEVNANACNQKRYTLNDRTINVAESFSYFISATRAQAGSSRFTSKIPFSEISKNLIFVLGRQPSGAYIFRPASSLLFPVSLPLGQCDGSTKRSELDEIDNATPARNSKKPGAGHSPHYPSTEEVEAMNLDQYRSNVPEAESEADLSPLPQSCTIVQVGGCFQSANQIIFSAKSRSGRNPRCL
jgi:hypothetical protein